MWPSRTYPHPDENIKAESYLACTYPLRNTPISLLFFQPLFRYPQAAILVQLYYFSYHHAVCSFQETRFNDSWIKQSFAQTITRLTSAYVSFVTKVWLFLTNLRKNHSCLSVLCISMTFAPQFFEVHQNRRENVFPEGNLNFYSEIFIKKDE